MAGPNFALETTAPLMDQGAQAQMAGYQYGQQLIQHVQDQAFQAGEAEKQRVFAAGQAHLQRLAAQAEAEKQRQYGMPLQNAQMARLSHPGVSGYTPLGAQMVDQSAREQTLGPGGMGPMPQGYAYPNVLTPQEIQQDVTARQLADRRAYGRNIPESYYPRAVPMEPKPDYALAKMQQAERFHADTLAEGAKNRGVRRRGQDMGASKDEVDRLDRVMNQLQANYEKNQDDARALYESQVRNQLGERKRPFGGGAGAGTEAMLRDTIAQQMLGAAYDPNDKKKRSAAQQLEDRLSSPFDRSRKGIYYQPALDYVRGSRKDLPLATALPQTPRGAGPQAPRQPTRQEMLAEMQIQAAKAGFTMDVLNTPERAADAKRVHDAALGELTRRFAAEAVGQ